MKLKCPYCSQVNTVSVSCITKDSINCSFCEKDSIIKMNRIKASLLLLVLFMIELIIFTKFIEIRKQNLENVIHLIALLFTIIIGFKLFELKKVN